MESDTYITQYFAKCDCYCHSLKNTKAEHIAPCCIPCDYCDMDVLSSMTIYHYEKFHKKAPIEEAAEILEAGSLLKKK